MYNKSSILDSYWLEFLDWCSSPRNYSGMGSQYESITVPNETGIGIRTPIVNENNFWVWFLEYKYTSHKQKIKDFEQDVENIFGDPAWVKKLKAKFKKHE